MYKITTYRDGTQSIVSLQEAVDVTVIDDGRPPAKVVEVRDIPNTRLGNIMRSAEKRIRQRGNLRPRARTSDKVVDLEDKKTHNDD